MRLPACFWQFGWPGYHTVGRTRDKREGYYGVEFSYHRWADAFYSFQSLHGAEWTEGVSVSNDAPGESGSDVPERLDLLLAGDIEIHRSGSLRRCLLPGFPLRLSEAGAPSGIRRFYLCFKGRTCSGIDRGMATEGPKGAV